MKLADVKTYTEGVLKKWFPTKKTIIDKLSLTDDNRLQYDGKELGKFDSVNLKSTPLMSTSITGITTDASTVTSVAHSTTLSDAIENYDFAVMKIVWHYTNNSTQEINYNWQAIVDTKKGSKSQWVSNTWFNDDGYTSSRNGITFRLYNKKLDIVQAYVDNGTTIEVEQLIGYKFTEVTDGTVFAHSHDNQDTLNKLSDNGTDLQFNGSVLTTTKRDILWSGQISFTGTDKTVNQYLDLDHSSKEYDCIVFYIDYTGYPITLISYNTQPGENYWVGSTYNTSQVGLIYKINNGGSITIDRATVAPSTTTMLLKKIVGIKY